jgi:hypothetical protein
MKKKRHLKPRNAVCREYLRQCLKTSYEDRLNWLEEANKFAMTVSGAKKRKFPFF